MLFDLRSRGRRSAVRVIYFGLAVLMFGGLVLFGVGAGNGLGGLLNAFTNSGSSSAQTQAVSQELKSAEKEARDNPSNANATANLLQAQWVAANQGSNVNSAGVYSANGQQLLRDATASWQKYVSQTSAPQSGVAIIASHAFEKLSQWSGAAGTWETVTLQEPTASTYFCFAASSYAAKQTRKGELAAGRAIQLAPELERLTIKQELAAAKTSTTIAQTLVNERC